MLMLEPPHAPAMFITHMFMPILTGEAGRDSAFQAVFKGYVPPANHDWSHLIGSLLTLTEDAKAPITQFCTDFQRAPATTLEFYICNLVMTLAACHLGFLWSMRERASFENDRKKVCVETWVRLCWAGTKPNWTKLVRDVSLLLAISRRIYALDEKIRMSVFLHPFFHLPMLIEHWTRVHMFLGGAAMRELPKVMLNAEQRKASVLEIVHHVSMHVSGALLAFAVELGESNGV
ncbi:hypothetical protein K438DRAFT_1975798 [Mycena galopus ATCC 62051]|nr:hypothetical protein K438DRAFT_1991130 [Mycena galopus ATCC 62051]KAF8162341.1 hypothetical protein K438DRAFT_1985265 [Mycena galopus ATCC 62051]KAF8182271.1 hypothetical protein K438DRAFT_1975798 [Mycena galopus ATCC 62051]